jgi:cytochrome c biogenesis factor
VARDVHHSPALREGRLEPVPSVDRHHVQEPAGRHERSLEQGLAEVHEIRPRRDTFFTWDAQTQQMVPSTNMSIPGAHSTMAGDFYAIITFWEGNRVTFRAYLNPLINFVWLGGLILIIGTMVALWPSRRPAAVPVAAAPAELGSVRTGGGR